MLKVVMFWALSLAVLVGGAVVVCPEGQCVLNDFDRIGLSLAHALRSERLDGLMSWVTWLGSLWLLLPLSALVAWFLYRGGRGREAGFVILAVLGSSALSHLVKLWVARPRPDLFAAWLPLSETWSYPSSHAMQATAAALADPRRQAPECRLACTPGVRGVAGRRVAHLPAGAFSQRCHRRDARRSRVGGGLAGPDLRPAAG
jgi:hypothetical protein